MLTLKSGLCPLCASDDPPKPLIAGLCQIHYWGSRRTGSGHIQRSVRLTRQAPSPPTADDIAQELWYKEQVGQMDPYCWECKAPIVVANYRFAKASIAHVLPKEIFGSVACHPQNFLILGGGCGCHRKYDKSWYSAWRMKVFPVAIERFMLFAPEISEEERRRIPDVFMPYLLPAE